VRVTLGRFGERAEELSLKNARDKAAAIKAEMRAGIDPRKKTIRAAKAAEKAARPAEVTLRTAYAHYISARTGKKRKPLSPVTKAGYDRVIERSLIDFVDLPLREIADDPRSLIDHFNLISQDRPAEANTRMRLVRAVWNRAHKVMPAKVPPPPIWDLNEVEARNAGFVTAEVPALWKAIDAISDPLRKKRRAHLSLYGPPRRRRPSHEEGAHRPRSLDLAHSLDEGEALEASLVASSA
jgi:hypothetical protein